MFFTTTNIIAIIAITIHLNCIWNVFELHLNSIYQYIYNAIKKDSCYIYNAFNLHLFRKLAINHPNHIHLHTIYNMVVLYEFMISYRTYLQPYMIYNYLHNLHQHTSKSFHKLSHSWNYKVQILFYSHRKRNHIQVGINIWCNHIG